MNRTLRMPILTFLTALVTMAAVAPSAFGESFIFRADTGEMTLTGAQHGSGDQFTTELGSVECSSITYSGTATSDEMESLDLAPTYSGCTAFGFAGAEVKANGCKYRLNPGTMEGSTFEGDMDIVCPEGNSITATAKVFGFTVCVVHIPPQEGLGSVSYANVGSEPEELTVSLALSGISYTVTSGSACEAGSAENGTYEGAAQVTGEFEGESGTLGVDRVGTWISITPKPLNFKTLAVGAKTDLTIKNEHALRKYIREMKIVNMAEAVDETLFKIVAGGTCKEELKSLEECTVKIENLTANANLRSFRFKYSGWGWFATRHIIKRDVIHE